MANKVPFGIISEFGKLPRVGIPRLWQRIVTLFFGHNCRQLIVCPESNHLPGIAMLFLDLFAVKANDDIFLRLVVL